MWILTHVKENLPTIVSVRSGMVSWFCVWPTKVWFLKVAQVIMKLDPFDAMYEFK